MPIFEYRCETCGAIFERLMVRPRPTFQIACGSPQTAKVFSTFITTGGNEAPVGRAGQGGGR